MPVVVDPKMAGVLAHDLRVRDTVGPPDLVDAGVALGKIERLSKRDKQALLKNIDMFLRGAGVS